MLLFWLSLCRAEAPEFDAWVARGDAAAAELARAGTDVATLAAAIGSSGRVQRLAELHAASETLVRRAAALRATVDTELPAAR